MPNTSLKFKCPQVSCQHWFTLYQAKTEKRDNGTTLLISCPTCGGYVEKIQRVLTGRGTNLEPKDVVYPIASSTPAPSPSSFPTYKEKLDYLTRMANGELMCPLVPKGRLAPIQHVVPPCGKGRGDTSPRMLRAISQHHNIARVMAESSRRIGRKRPR